MSLSGRRVFWASSLPGGEGFPTTICYWGWTSVTSPCVREVTSATRFKLGRRSVTSPYVGEVASAKGVSSGDKLWWMEGALCAQADRVGVGGAQFSCAPVGGCDTLVDGDVCGDAPVESKVGGGALVGSNVCG